MKKTDNKEITFLDNLDIPDEYGMLKLEDNCEDILKIKNIDLPKELEQQMPLLIKVFPPKKKTLKRR